MSKGTFREFLTENGVRIMGKHFDSLPMSLEQVDLLGGRERIEHLSDLMREAESKLEPCPFCGHSAVVDAVFTYTSPGIRVDCPRCHIRTIPYTEGYDLIKRQLDSLEDCIEKAVNCWNRREGK